MKVAPKEFTVRGITYSIRVAVAEDAAALSHLRVQIDGESENLDRESGEDYIDAEQFAKIIKRDNDSPRHLFLVATVDKRMVGFSRCAGTQLKRLSHKVEFGVCVLKQFWGNGIGKHLLQQSISWADSSGIKKMVLHVLETNENAIKLYEKLGFEVEGILKQDKLLSDGKYYNTLVMSRISEL